MITTLQKGLLAGSISVFTFASAMLRMRLLIVGVTVLLSTALCGQSDNPFELRYKQGQPAPANPTARIVTPPAVDTPRTVVIDTPELVADDTVTALPTELIVDSPMEDTVVDLSLAEENIEAEDPVEPEPEEEIESAPPVSPQTPVPNVGVVLILTMLGISLLVLTWAVNMDRGFIRKIFRAAMNENLSALLLREQKFASLQYLYYIVYAVFFINAALFVFLITRFSTWELGRIQAPLIAILGVLLAIYLSRHIFMRVIGDTFTISGEMTHYSFNIILYNILAGISLIPINLVLAYGPPAMRMPVIYIGLGLIGLLYLLRQLRGLNIAGHLISQNFFQFFVYLCAVEILPALVLFKYFITS